jgi:hypothetical protein
MMASVPHEFMQISFLGVEVRPGMLFQQALHNGAIAHPVQHVIGP